MPRKNFFIGIFTTFLLLGLLGGAVVMAKANSGSNSKPFDLYQNFISKLAANLGVEESKLEEAIKAAKQELLTEEVQKGVITQAQADQISASPRLDFGKHGAPGKREKGIPMSEGSASILGISQEQLKSELQSGKKLKDIVEAQGMTMDQFREKLTDYDKEKIARDLAAGTITQEQADRMLERLEAKNNASLPGKGHRGR